MARRYLARKRYIKPWAIVLGFVLLIATLEVIQIEITRSQDAGRAYYLTTDYNFLKDKCDSGQILSIWRSGTNSYCGLKSTDSPTACSSYTKIESCVSGGITPPSSTSGVAIVPISSSDVGNGFLFREGETVTARITFKNVGDTTGDTKAEFGIYSASLRPTLLGREGAAVEPFTNCQGSSEEFVDTAEITDLAPGQTITASFTIHAPSEASYLASGTSNWASDGKYIIIAGAYQTCGVGYVPSEAGGYGNPLVYTARLTTTETTTGGAQDTDAEDTTIDNAPSWTLLGWLKDLLAGKTGGGATADIEPEACFKSGDCSGYWFGLGKVTCKDATSSEAGYCTDKFSQKAYCEEHPSETQCQSFSFDKWYSNNRSIIIILMIAALLALIFWGFKEEPARMRIAESREARKAAQAYEKAAAAEGLKELLRK